jgi:sugar/nucleoside kinase (ribokinase family)
MRYLAIGHICQDLLPDGWMFGGAATYSSRMAHALGCQVQVVTSLRADVDVRPALADVEVVNYPAEHTTTFENVRRGQVRRHAAETSDTRALSAAWRRFASGLARKSIWLLDLSARDRRTPQGWLRQWDAQGRISPIGWAEAAEVLPRADVVIISSEDVAHDEAVVQHWATQAKLLVVTRGAHGCTVHHNNSVTAVPTHSVEIVDATGAGDIFAASFLVRLRQTRDPIAAARFANCLASQSITRRGLDSIPTPSEIDQCCRV